MLRFQFTIRRMLIVVAIAAIASVVLRALTTPALAPTTHDFILLNVPTPIGPDGRKGTYTDAEWAALIKRLTSPQVLDAALADERIASLRTFTKSPTPRAALARAIGISVQFSLPETTTHPAINAVGLHVDSPVDVHNVADAVADAIAIRELKDTSLSHFRPTSMQEAPHYLPLPWYSAWQILGVLSTTALAMLSVCFRWEKQATKDASPLTEL